MTRIPIMACLCLVQLTLWSEPAWSQDATPLVTHVSAVTVFPQGAAVTRAGSVSLSRDTSRIEIAGLPGDIESSSVRVKYAGAAGEVVSVETRTVYHTAPVREEEQALKAELETYEAQRRELDDRITAARMQLDLIKQVGTTAIRGPEPSPGTSAAVLSGEALQKLFQSVGLTANDALTVIRQAEQQTKAVDLEIDRLKKTIRQLRGGRKATTTIVINLFSSRAENGQLQMTYFIPDASWRPLYEARLDTEMGKIALAARAEVEQSTGEDWMGAEVALSTTNPTWDPELPELDSWYIDFLPKEEPKPVARYGGYADGAMEAPAAGMEEVVVTARKREEASEFAAEYHIPGRIDIPADDAPHTFLVANHDLDADLSAEAHPGFSNYAYLIASASYEGAMPLLSGEVALFRDGAYVGQGYTPLIRPKEDVELSFGADDRIKVEFQDTVSTRSDTGISFINKRKRHERGSLVTVENLHGREIEIALVARIPVSRDKEIEVELLPSATPPTARDIDERPGVLEWRYPYKAGESKEINIGFAVSHPEGREITDFD